MKYRLIFGCLGSVLASSPAHAIDLDISGFGSFIGGYSEKGNGYLQYAQDDLDYQPDSLAGLQVSGRINDKATATVQIISRAMENWGTSADWAYVTYQPRSDFTWKMGRYRGPFFLYSENILVGYTYPWVSPPYSAYNIPFTSVDGLSLTYSRSLNDVDLEFQAYSGNSHFSGETGVLEGIEGDARAIFGVVSQASWEDWVARLALHRTKLDFDLSGSSQGAAFTALEQALRAGGFASVADDLLIEDDCVIYGDAAIQYDNGRFLGIAESTYFNARDTTPIGPLTTYYITAGIRDNSLLYHLTYGRSDGDEADITGNLPPDSLTYSLVRMATYAFLPQDDTWTAGVRWDFAEGMAFKVEATYLPEYHPRVVDTDDQYSMTVVRLGVQTIF